MYVCVCARVKEATEESKERKKEATERRRKGEEEDGKAILKPRARTSEKAALRDTLTRERSLKIGPTRGVSGTSIHLEASADCSACGPRRAATDRLGAS